MPTVIHKAGEGEKLAAGASTILLKADAEVTDGAFALAETVVAPGFPGPPPHFHEKLHDVFYVLEGTLTVLVGEQEHELGPGDFAHIAPGTVHTFSNRTDSEARVLNLSTPGGFEAYLRELSEAMAGGEFDPAVVAGIAERYDIKLAN